MNIAEKCIQRPVFTCVLMCLLLIIGFISYKQLTVRHYPNISKPTISILTLFNGASPELIEKEITIPLENIVSGINGIANIRSKSVLGKSRIYIDFKLGKDIDEALNEIRNKSTGFFRKLPAGAEMPQVYRNDDDVDPVAIIGFQDKERSPLEITDYIKRYVLPVMQESNGVGEVELFGAREYVIKIELQPLQMASYKITVADIKRALKQQSVDIPGGQIKSKNRFYTVVAHARLSEPQQFDSIVVGHHNHHPIHLSEVAKVIIGDDNEDRILRINGQSAVGLAILPQSTANPVDVAGSVRKSLEDVRQYFPSTMQANVFFDSTEYIKRSIFEVYKTFIEASIFVALVVLLFLGNFRSALIPIITIPICIIASFAPIQWLGYDLNTLTMLALVLAIGLVVDDAIVVLENCHRHMQSGKNARTAAITGGKEITFALIAMTITLAAVYVPMAFVEGFTGKLLQQFGITLSIAVLISGLVALTLSPLMCSKLLSHKEGRYSRWLDKVFTRLELSYAHALRRGVKHPFLLAMFLCTSLGLGLYCLQNIGSELAPVEDQSYLIGPVMGPTNTSSAYMDEYVKKLEAIYADVPEQTNWLVSIRPSYAFTLLKLRSWEDRVRSQQAISDSLKEPLENLTGVTVKLRNSNPLSQGGSKSSFSFALIGNKDFSELHEVTQQFMKDMERSGKFEDIKNYFSMDSEQIDIHIDRQLANDLEVNMGDISELISTMVGGDHPVNYTYDGQSYNVVLRLDNTLRNDISLLNQLYVQSARGKMIPLSAIISVGRSIGPDNFPHLNRLRSVNISANLTNTTKVNQAVEVIRNIAADTLPDGVQFKFTGGTEDYLESSNSTIIAFVLALVFIYLVLAAQFESFIDPFVVLLTVPLCLLSSISCLYLSGNDLSIYSTIGLITLIGLITKHGILITEFANTHHLAGSSSLEAVIAAARTRLRPILMTTLAMVLGAFPLALASGAGAESRRILGIVILSGMSIGTLFSLLVVPAAWLALSKLKNHLGKTSSTDTALLAQD